MQSIRENVDPKRYPFSDIVWNSLILNSRIRFHSFFRHAHELKEKEELALKEYAPKWSHLKRYVFAIAKYFALTVFFRKKKNGILKKLENKEIILHKTFAYSSSFANNKFNDPFFMNYTDNLVQRDNYLIVVDPIMSYQDTKNLLLPNELDILPWYSFLGLKDYFKALKIQISTYLMFKPRDNPWEREYKQELIHPTTFQHLLFYFAFERISKLFNVKRLVVTCENNSWEKIIIQCFRKNSGETKIIGYQHSCVPESALGMRFLPWEQETENLPDIIYTTGMETRNILRSFNPDIKTPIEALCALRYDYLFSMTHKETQISRKLLVVLEAIEEARYMIDIVLSLKKYLVDNNFEITFRFHPAMNYDYFKKLVDYRELESFALVSKNSLINDLNHHDCIMYWGSTVGLEAGYIGNVLINYNSSFPLSHDPLFSCNHLKWNIKDSVELQNSLDEIFNMDLSLLNSERKKMKTFIESYFHKTSIDHIKELQGN